MSDPTTAEAVRDAQRRSAQRERANDELKDKIREMREIMAQFGIKEKAKGSYTVDYKTLILSLGEDQARELAEELADAGYSGEPIPKPKKRGRPKKQGQ